MIDKDIEEATFKAGYAFANTGLDINAAWIKYDEVQTQIRKNAMKHPITGEEIIFTPEEVEIMRLQRQDEEEESENKLRVNNLDNTIWEK